MKEEILLIGNPNTGKTTLFNTITKSEQHTGNWHGVTVELARKDFSVLNESYTLVDLPGIYSLTTLSYEEEVSVNYLINNLDKKIIYICDKNNLTRNLYLLLELIEISSNVIVFVNSFGEKIEDYSSLQKELGIEVLCGDASNEKDVKLLKQKIKGVINSSVIPKYVDIELKTQLEKELTGTKQQKLLRIKNYLESDEKCKNFTDLLNKKIDKINFEVLAEQRYKFINKILKKQNKIYGKSKLDNVLLNKYLAIPVFFVIMFVVFYLTFFSVGKFLSTALSFFIQNIIGRKIVEFVSEITTLPWIVDFLENGIIGGVGSLISFLPQIVLLFLFLSLIEDSGYLSRIAFLFDDMFAKVGLSGKSVYTLLMSFGCSTSAALTARNMEDKSAKIKTAILTPYMSCSAKLPIYAVIGGAFFGAGNIFVIFLLYLLGILCSLIVSIVLEKTKLKTKRQSFILEFPEYRISSPKKIYKVVLQNVKMFLVRVGTLLISLNIIVWILQSFSFSFNYVPNSNGVSMLEQIGKVFAPIFIPLGFGSWGAVSALFAGVLAKEVIVSSIAIFNGVDANSSNFFFDTSVSIMCATSVVSFTPASAISYMVFCLLYTPCIATISVLLKEIGKKWTIISILIQLIVAYSVSLLTFHTCMAVQKYGFLNFLLVLFFILVAVLSIRVITKKVRSKSFCDGCCKKCNETVCKN